MKGDKAHPKVFRAAMRRKAIGVRNNIFVCKNCGKAYIRWRRVQEEGKTYCSRECAYEYKVGNKKVRRLPEYRTLVFFQKCGLCGEMFTARSASAKYCSTDCLREFTKIFYSEGHKTKQRESYQAMKGDPYIRECEQCGAVFHTWRGSTKTCSEECSKKRSNHIHHVNRRVRKRNAFVENVSVGYLFLRDSARCQLCGKKLNITRKVPHKLAATIDHIIPLSKGGEHSKRNTQLCCFECNYVKGDRPVEGGEQLRLFG